MTARTLAPAGVQPAPGDSIVERTMRRLGALYRLVYVDGMIGELELLELEDRATWHGQILAKYRAERARLVGELGLVERGRAH